MIQAIINNNPSAAYSENLLPVGSGFNDMAIVPNKTSGGANAAATYNGQHYVDGPYGIRSYNDTSTAFTFDFGDSLEFTAPRTAMYYVSIQAKAQDNGILTVQVFVDSSVVEEIVIDFTEVEKNVYHQFFQNLQFSNADVVSFGFKHETPGGSAKSTLYFDAMKVEIADKGYYPTAYTKSIV